MKSDNQSVGTKGPAARTLVININLSAGRMVLLLAALLVVALLATLTWGQKGALASSHQAPLLPIPDRALAATAEMRQYYLAGAVISGSLAADACAEGYHMASLWEILDTSNLVYNTTLGLVQGDSGSGPPTLWSGWVRTGYNSDNGTTAGQANCSAWSVSSGYGTTASLPANWVTAPGEIHIWTVGTSSCGSPAKVWCVED